MENVELYVAGQKLDLVGGDLITLQKRIGYVETGETALRQGEYSETFLLPDTPINRLVFKANFLPHSNNPPQRYSALIFANTYLVARGVVEAEGLVFGPNGKSQLRVTFLGQEVDFFLSLDQPLNTLDLSELNNQVTGSLTNINTLTFSQSAYFDPTASLSLSNSVKFGFVDYFNTPYYTNTPGQEYRDLGPLDLYVGLGGLNGGQHFYWSGSYNFLAGTGSNAPTTTQLQNNRPNLKTYTLGAPNSQSVDTLYGKGGFYLGYNYNAYLSNAYIIDKIISEEDYTWTTKDVFPTDHPILNSQLIYKDFSRPGTNQYWYKQVNDRAETLDLQRYNYNDDAWGSLSTVSSPLVTASLRLVDEQGTVVKSGSVSFTSTIGNPLVSTATGIWRVGLDDLNSGSYSIDLAYSFRTPMTTSGGPSGSSVTHIQEGTGSIIDKLATDNFKKDNQYFFNFLPEDYIGRGSFYYDGQDGVNFELHYNFDRSFYALNVPSDNFIFTSASLSMPNGGTQLRFGVDTNEMRLNWSSMLPNITRGQYLSQMIKLGNLFFDIDEKAREFRAAPFLEFYRGYKAFGSASQTPIDISTLIDATSAEIQKIYPYNTYTISSNFNSGLPYVPLWQAANSNFISNPSSFTYDVTSGYKGTDFSVNIDFDHVIPTPKKDLLNTILSGVDPTYAETYVPSIDLQNGYNGITLGCVFPMANCNPARTIFDADGRVSSYTFAPLVDTTNVTPLNPSTYMYLDAATVLFTSYHSASSYGAIDNKCFKYVYDTDICDWDNDFFSPIVSFATFTTTYESSQRGSAKQYTIDTNTQDTYYDNYFYQVRLNQNKQTFDPLGAGNVFRASLSYTEQRFSTGSVYWKPTLDLIDTSYGDFLGLNIPTGMGSFRRLKVTAYIPDYILGQLEINKLLSVRLWDTTMIYYINNIETNLDGKNTCNLDLIQFNY